MKLYNQYKNFHNLKKVAVAALIILGTSFCANKKQETISTQSGMVGYWNSDSTSIRLVFFYDKSNKLRLVEWDDKDGEEMELLKFDVTNEQVKTTERMRSTNHVIYNTYTLKDENTIENTFNGDDSSTVIFKRLF